MDLPSFDPPTLALMGRVCDEVWLELQSKHVFPSVSDETEIRHQIARRVMSAVAAGEQDPQRLKAWALHSLAS
jgi:hypothetical protein